MYGYDDEFFLYPGSQGPVILVDAVDSHASSRSFGFVPELDEAELDHSYMDSFFFVNFGIQGAITAAELVGVFGLPSNDVPTRQDPDSHAPPDYFGPVFSRFLYDTLELHFGEVPQQEPVLGPEYLDQTAFVFTGDPVAGTEWNVQQVHPVFEEMYAESVYNDFASWEEILPAPPTPLDPADGIPYAEAVIVTIEQVNDDCLSGLPEHAMDFFFWSTRRVFDVSALSVFNIAFMELGLPPANALTDSSHHVVRVNAIWPNFRKAFLQDHPWNGAKKTVQLSLRVEKPVARWDNMFDIPTDFIQALSVNGRQLQDGDDLWEVETTPDGLNKVIMTDAHEVYLEYIFDPVEVGILAPMVIEAMGLALAAKVAGAFGKKASERAQLSRRAEEAARQTRSNDSREGIPRFFSNDDLIDASDDPRGRFPTQGV